MSPHGLNVILTGTSNALYLNGFATGLEKHPFVNSFQNKSLGASGTVALPFHADRLDLAGTDYLLIEYSINENQMLRHGREKKENTINQLAGIIDKASRSGCIPILVNFSAIDDLGKSTPMSEFIEREFANRGVACFDVAGIVNRASGASQIELSQFFYDPLHLQRTVAFTLGQILIDKLQTWRDGPRPGFRATDLTFRDMAYVVAPPGTGGVVTRSTSVASSQLVRLSHGGSITFDPFEDDVIVRGCIYNTAKSRGSIYFEDGPVILKTSHPAYGGPRELVLVGLPLRPRKMLSGSPTSIRFEAPPEDIQATFEIAGLVVEFPQKECTLHVTSLGPAYNALHEHVNADDIRRICESATPT